MDLKTVQVKALQEGDKFISYQDLLLEIIDMEYIEKDPEHLDNVFQVIVRDIMNRVSILYYAPYEVVRRQHRPSGRRRYIIVGRA